MDLFRVTLTRVFLECTFDKMGIKPNGCGPNDKITVYTDKEQVSFCTCICHPSGDLYSTAGCTSSPMHTYLQPKR